MNKELLRIAALLERQAYRGVVELKDTKLSLRELQSIANKDGIDAFTYDGFLLNAPGSTPSILDAARPVAHKLLKPVGVHNQSHFVGYVPTKDTFRFTYEPVPAPGIDELYEEYSALKKKLPDLWRWERKKAQKKMKELREQMEKLSKNQPTAAISVKFKGRRPVGAKLYLLSDSKLKHFENKSKVLVLFES